MCGIVGGVSDRNVLPILIEGLKRLEYRGYDSAGVAFRENSKISLIKAKGRVLDLENKLPEKKIKSNQGIAHTRCCLLYTSPSPRDRIASRMPSSA